MSIHSTWLAAVLIALALPVAAGCGRRASAPIAGSEACMAFARLVLTETSGRWSFVDSFSGTEQA